MKEDMLGGLMSVVSPKYHDRLREVSEILDGDFEVEKCSNSAVLRSKVLKHTRDVNGYRHIDHVITPLSGGVVFAPHFKVEGDFALVLTKSRVLDPVNRVVHKNQVIHVYEKEESMIKMLGGV